MEHITHTNWIVTLLYGGGAILFIAVGIPLIMGVVKRNHFYGFRTPKTLSADHIWYAANRLMGWDLIRVGILCLICVVALMALSFEFPQLRLSAIDPIIMLSAVALMLAHGFWRLSKM